MELNVKRDCTLARRFHNDRIHGPDLTNSEVRAIVWAGIPEDEAGKY